MYKKFAWLQYVVVLSIFLMKDWNLIARKKFVLKSQKDFSITLEMGAMENCQALDWRF